MPPMTRGRWVIASTLALLVGVAPAAALAGFTSRAAGTPTVPSGYALTDLITDNGFETSNPGFAPFYPADGSVARTTTHPISGGASLHLTVNAYGRVGLTHQYAYAKGPVADSVTVAAKVRVDSASAGGRQLQGCSIASLFHDNTPRL